jgi:hypothetical protein
MTLTRNEDAGYSGISPCYGTGSVVGVAHNRTATDEMNKSRVVGNAECDLKAVGMIV